MLRVESSSDMKGFTEYEEDILFDHDDPDFRHNVQPISVPIIYRENHNLQFQPPTITLETSLTSMSLVGVHPREFHSNPGSLSSFSYSLDDITNCCSPQFNSDHVLTIEELRLQMSSCFTCGVSWAEDHVSLDCSECGGYALERPCLVCDGSCGSMWKRDLTKSHSSNKAQWEGECNSTLKQSASTTAQELCSKLEKLSSHS
ncbi:hypothetical protein FQA39_LY14589 [Lamprigera yunnana]|nr:hypothetical protein FQA39_LY14589 [Lamprigera yunnana]